MIKTATKKCWLPLDQISPFSDCVLAVDWFSLVANDCTLEPGMSYSTSSGQNMNHKFIHKNSSEQLSSVYFMCVR